MHDFSAFHLGASTDAVHIDSQASVPCALRLERPTGSVGFRSGTRVLTTHGPCAVQNLVPGLHVHTRDHGIQPITWCGPTGRNGGGEHAFLRIAPGTFGTHDALHLAPRQTVLLSSWTHKLFPNYEEALVEVRGLDSLPGIARVTGRIEPCYQVLLPTHALIMAEGIWSESLHPENIATQSVWKKAAEDIDTLIADQDYGPRVLPVLSGQKARNLLRD